MIQKVKQRVSGDELAAALALVDEIDQSEFALARPSARPMDIVADHIQVIRGAIDKGYPVRRIADFVAQQLGGKMSSASLRSAISRALKMSVVGSTTGAKKSRAGRSVAPRMAQAVASTATTPTGPAQEAAQAPTPAVIAPSVSSVPQISQPVTQPAVTSPTAPATVAVTIPGPVLAQPTMQTGIAAMFPGAAHPGQPSGQPTAQQVA